MSSFKSAHSGKTNIRSRNLDAILKESKQLEEENEKMDKRLKELKLAMTKEKAARERDSPIWQSGRTGAVGTYANEVLQTKRPTQATTTKPSKIQTFKVLKDEPADPTAGKSNAKTSNLSRGNVVPTRRPANVQQHGTALADSYDDDDGGDGGALLNGQYDEREAAHAFQQALLDWRRGNDQPAQAESPAKTSQQQVKAQKKRSSQSVSTTTQGHSVSTATQGSSASSPMPDFTFSSSLTYAEKLLVRKHRRSDVEEFFTEGPSRASSRTPIAGSHSLRGSYSIPEEDSHLPLDDPRDMRRVNASLDRPASGVSLIDLPEEQVIHARKHVPEMWISEKETIMPKSATRRGAPQQVVIKSLDPPEPTQKARPQETPTPVKSRPSSGNQRSRPQSASHPKPTPNSFDLHLDIITTHPTMDMHEVSRRNASRSQFNYDPTGLEVFFAGAVDSTANASSPRPQTGSRPSTAKERVSNKLYQMCYRSWKPDASVPDAVRGEVAVDEQDYMRKNLGRQTPSFSRPGSSQRSGRTSARPGSSQMSGRASARPGSSQRPLSRPGTGLVDLWTREVHESHDIYDEDDGRTSRLHQDTDDVDFLKGLERELADRLDTDRSHVVHPTSDDSLAIDPAMALVQMANSEQLMQQLDAATRYIMEHESELATDGE